MKFLPKNFTKSIFFLSLILVIFPLITRAGFGLSPGNIVINEALRGSSFEKVFVISRSDPIGNLIVTVEPFGDTATWFQFDRGNKFTYPEGEKQFPIKSIVTIPGGTPNGTYTGKIRFSGSVDAANNTEGASVGIKMGALADISITVTDQEIKSFRLIGLQAEKAVEGQPLILSLTLENTGNVDIQPSYIMAEIYDKFHKSLLATFKVSKFEGFAKVESSGKILATILWTIPDAGNYWVDVSIFGDKNQLIAEESLPFDAAASTGLLASVDKSSVIYLIMGGIIIFLIVVIIVFVILLISTRNKQTKELAEMTKHLMTLVKNKNRSNGKKK